MSLLSRLKGMNYFFTLLEENVIVRWVFENFIYLYVQMLRTSFHSLIKYLLHYQSNYQFRKYLFCLYQDVLAIPQGRNVAQKLSFTIITLLLMGYIQDSIQCEWFQRSSLRNLKFVSIAHVLFNKCNILYYNTKYILTVIISATSVFYCNCNKFYDTRWLTDNNINPGRCHHFFKTGHFINNKDNVMHWMVFSSVGSHLV
jgi:hypothetical protein